MHQAAVRFRIESFSFFYREQSNSVGMTIKVEVKERHDISRPRGEGGPYELVASDVIGSTWELRESASFLGVCVCGGGGGGGGGGGDVCKYILDNSSYYH